MNSNAIKILQDVITNWKSNRRFTFENKQVYSYHSPIVDDEIVLRFSIALNSFFCKGQTIEISLTSSPFHTATISDNPLSENLNGDKLRLEAFLEEFDNAFYTKFEEKLLECLDDLTTSDPIFF